jgi:PAS domain S-box-containing protein
MIGEGRPSDEALIESERRLATLIANLPGMAYRCANTPDWPMEFISEGCGILTGYPAERVMAKSPDYGEIIVPEDRRQVWDDVQSAVSRRVAFELTYRIVRADGETRWVWERGRGVFDDGGELRFLEGFISDITEKRSIEAQLRHAQKLESVGRLAGGVAHDFNNLLTGIMGFAELGRDRLPPDHPVRSYLDQILRDARRSAAITRQLLAFARKQTIAPRVLDINGAVEGMLDMLRRLIGEDIHLAWSPGTGVWPVQVDPAQIDQILANLCVNARDAIEGVGKITVETGMAEIDDAYCADHAGFLPGDYVVLAVSDDGCGMSREIVEHIFEPFFTTKPMGEGTGLGLSTVYGIVKQNAGFIHVYSEPGKGTSFRIYLPRAGGEAEDLVPAGPPSDLVGGTETILIVEDESAVRETMGIFLRDLGYTVFDVDRPGVAIERSGAYGGRIHLLITDVVLPEMNGRQLAEQLCEMRPGLKILFISGYTANVIAARSVLKPGVNFLAKPFSRADLAGKVRQVIDG